MGTFLSSREIDRYDRQILIEEIGLPGQERLKRASVVICGAGGLGSPAAYYLTAAGVGRITLVDQDRVALSNLNRQTLHGESDIGVLKVDSAKQKLRDLNSGVDVRTAAEAMTGENVMELLAGHDVIIDALDNMETRLLLNKTALTLGIPFVHGAVNGFEGRVLTVIPGSTCLKCLHRGPLPQTAKFPVIGVTPAVIGAVQATEAIKIILGAGDLLVGRLVIYDGLEMKWKELRVRKNPKCDHCSVK